MTEAIMELNVQEIDEVVGGTTPTTAQCTSMFALGGGILGAYVVGAPSAGFGSWAGFQVGSIAGTAFGAWACSFSG